MKTLLSVLTFGALLFVMIGCGKQCGEGYTAVRQLRSTATMPGMDGNVYEETVCMKNYEPVSTAETDRAMREFQQRQKEQAERDRKALERQKPKLN